MPDSIRPQLEEVKTKVDKFVTPKEIQSKACLQTGDEVRIYTRDGRYITAYVFMISVATDTALVLSVLGGMYNMAISDLVKVT